MSHLPARPTLLIHPGYVRQVCVKLQGDGVDVAPVLAAARLTMADVFRVDRPFPLDEVRRLLQAARSAAPRPSLALELGLEVQLPLLGAIGVAAMSAPTVAEGIAVIARFGGQVNPAVQERLEATPQGVRVHVEPTCPLGDIESFMLERRLATVLQLTRSIAGRGTLAGTRVQVAGGDPAWHEAWPPLGVAVSTLGAGHWFDLPEALARRPAADADPAVHAAACQACEAAARGEQRALLMPGREPPAALASNPGLRSPVPPADGEPREGGPAAGPGPRPH